MKLTSNDLFIMAAYSAAVTMSEMDMYTDDSVLYDVVYGTWPVMRYVIAEAVTLEEAKEIRKQQSLLEISANPHTQPHYLIVLHGT